MSPPFGRNPASLPFFAFGFASQTQGCITAGVPAGPAAPVHGIHVVSGLWVCEATPGESIHAGIHAFEILRKQLAFVPPQGGLYDEVLRRAMSRRSPTHVSAGFHSFPFCAMFKSTEYRMTLTIDLIDSGALNLLRDMERLNLIRVNPPAHDHTRLAAAEGKTLPDRGTAEKKDTQRSTPLTNRLLGIAAQVGDMSLDELRSERLSKYLK
jgi:hypothetical protein